MIEIVAVLLNAALFGIAAHIYGASVVLPLCIAYGIGMGQVMARMWVSR